MECLARGREAGEGQESDFFLSLWIYLWLRKVLAVACGILSTSSLLGLKGGLWPCCMWDLSSRTRDQTCVPWIARQILNHWNTKAVPECI